MEPRPTSLGAANGGEDNESDMKRVLVVDDEPPVARFVEAALEAAKVEHTLDYCSDGAQGRVKASQEQYDLITLDVHMPLMGGVEALREIKRNPKSADTPIVIITGQQDPGFHKRVMQFGAAAVVKKPFGIEDLGEILSKVLAGEPLEPTTGPEDDSDIRPLHE